jgi:polar amino acid transport system substrate-binding protein
MKYAMLALGVVLGALGAFGWHACCALTARLDVLERARTVGVVRVGVKADTPPFGWKDDFGRHGFDVDIANALAKGLGIPKVEFVTVTSADRLDKVATGEIDMAIASMTITRRREQKVDFTIPYFQEGQALLVSADSTVGGYEDLAGKAVAAVRGSTSVDTIRQVQPECTVVEVGGFGEALDALREGRVAAVTSDMLILIGLMRDAKDGSSLRVAGERFSTEPYGIAVAENQSKLRDALNDTLQSMWEDGRWQRIYESWFGENAKYHAEVPFAIVPYPH